MIRDSRQLAVSLVHVLYSLARISEQADGGGRIQSTRSVAFINVDSDPIGVCTIKLIRKLFLNVKFFLILENYV